MNRWLAFIAVLLLPLLVFGQYRTQAKPVNLAASLKNPIGIGQSAMALLGLDPARLHMSQSYQMSYMSIGGKGYSQGVYLNTLTYDFSIPLTMAVQWGIAHQPLSGIGTSPLLNSGPFLSGAQLYYRPTKNTSIRLEFSQYPLGYDSWYDRRSALDQ
jgi:hypothetical protein